MSKKVRLSGRAGAIALTFVVAFIVPPQAANALEPCGFAASGTYHLPADAECIGNGIIVGSDNTKIFLDGHTLEAAVGGTGIVGGTFDKLKIYGPGTLTGWNIAIDLTGSDKVKLRDVTVTDGTTGVLVVGDKNHLQGNHITGNDGWAIDVIGEKNHLEGNDPVSGNGGGIKLAGDKNKADGNKVTGSTTDDGIYVPAGEKVDVSNNTSSSNAGDGVDADTNYIKIDSNTLESNTLLGATAPDEPKVKGVNTCTLNNGGNLNPQASPPRLCFVPAD